MGGGEGSINEGFKPNTSVLNNSNGVCMVYALTIGEY